MFTLSVIVKLAITKFKYLFMRIRLPISTLFLVWAESSCFLPCKVFLIKCFSLPIFFHYLFAHSMVDPLFFTFITARSLSRQHFFCLKFTLEESEWGGGKQFLLIEIFPLIEVRLYMLFCKPNDLPFTYWRAFVQDLISFSRNWEIQSFG